MILTNQSIISNIIKITLNNSVDHPITLTYYFIPLVRIHDFTTDEIDYPLNSHLMKIFIVKCQIENRILEFSFLII